MHAWRSIVVASCAGAATTIVLGVSGALFGLPLVRMPAPTGLWRVGTVMEPFEGTPAEAVAKVWYPTPPSSHGRRATYGDAAKRSWRATIVSRLVAPSAIVDAPVGNGRFPVILSLPGWGGSRDDNTAQGENLASHGYVVIAFDDLDPEPPMDFSSTHALARSAERANRKLRAESAKIDAVVEALHTLDTTPGGRFFERLDLQRIGLFGFSFGGAVAAEVARRDPRVRAAVNLDGWMYGDSLRDGVPGPFLIVGTGEDRPSHSAGGSGAAPAVVASFDRDTGERMLGGLRRNGGWYVTVDRTDHYNFTDAAWLPSLRRTGLGTIDGRRCWNVVATSVQQFFDRSLRDVPAPFFEPGARLDSDVHVVAYPARAAVSALR